MRLTDVSRSARQVVVLAVLVGLVLLPGAAMPQEAYRVQPFDEAARIQPSWPSGRI